MYLGSSANSPELTLDNFRVHLIAFRRRQINKHVCESRDVRLDTRLPKWFAKKCYGLTERVHENGLTHAES